MTQNAGNSKRYGIVVFFASACTLSWIWWIPEALHSQGILSADVLSSSALVIGGFGPSLAGLLLTAAERRAIGLRDLLSRLFRWRVPPGWYLLALFAPPTLLLGALVVSAWWAGFPLRLPAIDNWVSIHWILGFLYISALGRAIGEEAGWRGYALPRLLESRGPLLSSLIIGAVGGIWHLPLFWIRGTVESGVPIGWFMGSILAGATLYTWLYARTAGSLLLACLFHASVNAWTVLLLMPLPASGSYTFQIACSLEILLAAGVTALGGRAARSRGTSLRKFSGVGPQEAPPDVIERS